MNYPRRKRNNLTNGMRFEIGARYLKKESISKLADEFGVSENTVRECARQLEWLKKELDREHY